MRNHEVVHHAHLYGSPDEYIRAVAAFVEAGARKGEPVMVALPGPKGDLLKPVLAGLRGVEHVDLGDLGRNPGRFLPAAMDFVADHAHPARIVAEPIWPGRDRDEVAEAARQESLVCRTRAEWPAEMLCLYDGRRLPPGTISEMWRSHPDVTALGINLSSAGYLGEPGSIPDSHWPLEPPPSSGETIEMDFYRVNPVRAGARAVAARAGLPVERVEDLVLAVTELAWHSILSGGGTGRLRMWTKSSGAAVCEVLDVSGRPEAEELWLVNQLCDLVQVRNGPAGTLIRIRIGP